MKQVARILTVSALAVLFEASCMGYAQGPKHENDHKQGQPNHEQHQQQHQGQGGQNRHEGQGQRHQGQGEQNRHQGQGHRQDENSHQRNAERKQEHNREHEVRQMQRSERQRGEQRAEQQRVWQQHRASHWESEHRNWQQRGGYNGYRIADNYFRDHYGRLHAFRVYNEPFMYESGNPRFQSHGYWFNMVEPYPEYWSPQWYRTDDVYVDYQNDGYYLFNRSYPGRPGIAITIVP